MSATWIEEAAALPLAFAQVREDPRLDVKLAETLPRGASVVMIASGADTAVRLARLPLGALLLVDVNSAQLSLSKLKWHLAESFHPDRSAAVLGHEPVPDAERAELLAALTRELDLPPDSFGPPALIARMGPDHAGRYERAFAALNAELSPWQKDIDRLLRSTDSAEASALAAPETAFGAALDAALARALSLPNLTRLFGNEATRNPRRPFHKHFAWRLRVVLARTPAAENPFLWQMLAGRFPDKHRCDWLRLDAERGPFRLTPRWHHGKMTDVLRALPERSVDLVHLSNILDWLSVAEAEETLRLVCQVLKPGGRVILRQLNSTLKIPELNTQITWDAETGAAFEAEDRSFFYPGIFVGSKP